MDKNKCISRLVSDIASHNSVKCWNVDKGINSLVIKLKEEIGNYDIQIFNQFLSDLNECKDVFESDAKFEYDKKDYTTVFIKLKKQTNMKKRLMRIILFFPCTIADGIYLILIGLPMYLVCGTDIASRESSIEWLVENTK
jgi:hypothetical protein